MKRIIMRKNTHLCVNNARVSQRADDEHDRKEENRRGTRQRFYNRQPDSILIGMTKMPRSTVLLHRRDYNIVVLSHVLSHYFLFLWLWLCHLALTLLKSWASSKWKVSKLKTLKWIFNWVGEFCPIGYISMLQKLKINELFICTPPKKKKKKKRKFELVHDA